MEVSYADTFEELKTKAFDLLHVAQPKRADSTILVEKSPNDFEAVSDKISASLDSILRMDVVFYIDDGGVNTRSTTRTSDEINGNNRRSSTLYGTTAT
jgi:hypothetical protein